MTDFKTIPNNWITVQVGDISLKVHYGYTTGSTSKNTGVKLLRITDLQNYKVNWDEVPFCEIAEYDIAKYLLREGDIVFARTGGTVGKSFLITGKIPTAIFASYLIRIQVSRNVNPKYLYYFFQSGDYWKQINSKISGIGQPNVNANSLSLINVPFSSLLEQNLIVSKIDELFSELNESEESLLKAKKMLEIYKYLTIKDAFEGKLTLDWAASNLKRSNQHKSFSKKPKKNSKLPLHWHWAKIKEVAEVTMGQSPPGESYNYKAIGTPLINGPVEFGPTPFSYTKLSKWTTKPLKVCKKGDLVICVRGSTTGRQNIAGFTACLGRGVAAISGGKEVEQSYLIHYFNYSRNKIFELGTGTTFPSISFEHLNEFSIPICPIEEQRQVVTEIEYKFTLIDNLESTILSNIRKIDFFRKSFLKKSFQGEFINPKTTYETTNDQLEEIRKEKKLYLEIEIKERKKKPKREKIMEEKKSILQILKTAKSPLSAKDIWLQSKHKDDIEGFYSELRELQDKVTEIKNDTESLLTLRHENR